MSCGRRRLTGIWQIEKSPRKGAFFFGTAKFHNSLTINTLQTLEIHKLLIYKHLGKKHKKNLHFPWDVVYCIYGKQN
mgnify:CR=1 FL=1